MTLEDLEAKRDELKSKLDLEEHDHEWPYLILELDSVQKKIVKLKRIKK